MKHGHKKPHRGSGTLAGAGNLSSERNHSNVGPDGYSRKGTGHPGDSGYYGGKSKGSSGKKGMKY